MGQVPEAVARAITERRLAVRVRADVPVQLRFGLRQRPARLLDLSLSGARLELEEPDVRVGDVLKIALPGTTRFERALRAAVVRIDEAPGVVAVHFFRPSKEEVERVRALVLDAMTGGEGERRERERVAYPRRVIARGADRPRVLIGTDLSEGGMRIAHSELPLGTEVQVALHAGGQLPPLVVSARVVRREADGAAALAFLELAEGEREHLAKLVREQPAVLDANGSPAVVSELVAPDEVAGGQPR